MKIRCKILLFIFIYCMTFTALVPFAEAALSSRYESPASAPSEQAQETKKAPASPAKAAPKAPSQGDAPVAFDDAEITFKKELKAKQLGLIAKEHDVYCKAFVDAEMGLRYFYKTQHDAIYRGAKAPTQEELEAMRFELSLLMKDLGSSAKRYASNIRMAKIAMMEMDERERGLFAMALGQIMATPAYAVDAGSLSGIEADLNSIAGATADVGLSTKAEYNIHHARFAGIEASIFNTVAALARAGEVAAATTYLAAKTGLAGAAIVASAALAMGAATTGGAIVGGVVFVGAVVGGGLDVVGAAIGFIDSVTESRTDTKTLTQIATAVNLVNVAAGAKSGEVVGITVVKIAVDAASASEGMWISAIFDETEKSDCPGKDGVNKMKAAQKSASSSGSRGGGGGG